MIAENVELDKPDAFCATAVEARMASAANHSQPRIDVSVKRIRMIPSRQKSAGYKS
jgi:hypothetical protein